LGQVGGKTDWVGGGAKKKRKKADQHADDGRVISRVAREEFYRVGGFWGGHRRERAMKEGAKKKREKRSREGGGRRTSWNSPMKRGVPSRQRIVGLRAGINGLLVGTTLRIGKPFVRVAKGGLLRRNEKNFE